MGADFCCQILIYEDDTNLDWDAGFRKLEELANEDGNISTPCYEDSLDGFKERLSEIKRAFEGDPRRDSGALHIGPYRIFITGGMSWGDDPTETYTDINQLNECPGVLEAVGFNLVDYKSILMKVLDRDEEQLPLLIGLDKDLDAIIEKRMK